MESTIARFKVSGLKHTQRADFNVSSACAMLAVVDLAFVL